MGTLRMAIVAAALAGIVFGPLPATATDVDDVVASMRAALRPDADMRAKFELTMSGPDTSTPIVWTGTYRRADGSEPRTRLAFATPRDLAHTVVLIHEGTGGDAYTRVYLPGLRRVRVLRGTRRGESFLGSDFDYEDLGLQPLAFRSHALEGEVAHDGRPCLRLVSTTGPGWWYGRIVTLVDRETNLPLRTEYYDRSDVLWKVRTLDTIETIAGHPTPVHVTMRTLPAKTETRMRLTDVRYDVPFTDDELRFP